MKKSFFLASAVALLMAACTKDQPTAPNGALVGTFEAPVAEVQTRAYFGDQFAFNWSSGDQISVLTSAGTKTFTLSTGAGTGTGVFVGSLAAGVTVQDKLSYPKKNTSSLTASSVSMTLPATYAYGNKVAISEIPTILPCWAEIAANAFTMKHLVGYAAFQIGNIPAGSNQFILNITNDQKINGSFTADLTQEQPAFSTSTTAIDAEKTITITFDASNEVTTRYFVIPAPVGTYQYEWYIYADEVLKGFGESETDLVITRGSIKGPRVNCASIGGGEPEDDPYNGHEYVDLGLPSGLKWATCNVGATTPEGYGDLFSWGETNPKDRYDWGNYLHGNAYMTKYCTNSSSGTVDNKTILDPEDDAAFINWGGNWRMPTDAELIELLTECTWTWSTVNDVNGYRVSGSNGNSIFLPASGVQFGANRWDVGSAGNYWSSSLNTDESSAAYCLSYSQFNNSNPVCINSPSRSDAQSIRPVAL